jgi:hypothetical protein
VAASPKQEAILVRDGDLTQVTLRTHYRSGPEELAWVVPVPAKPVSVTRADDSTFQKLGSLTTPSFTLLERKRGCGIGCSGGDTTPITGHVIVAETGRAGIFDYTVLTATGVESLTNWLRERHFAVPDGAEAVFQRYVDEDWYWLAIRVNSEESDKPTLALHPIKYTYRDTDLIYPLVISRLSADEENEILLYVLSTGRYRCENWGNATIGSQNLELDEESPSGTNYEKLFHQITRRNGGHVFITEFADNTYVLGHHVEVITRSYVDDSSKEARGVYVTRLRAVISPEAMDRDVTLVRGQEGDVSNDHYLDADAAGRNTGGDLATTAVLFGLVALTIGLCLLRLERRMGAPGRR